MKPLDWILLSSSVPWIIFNFIALFYYGSRKNVKSITLGAGFFVPWILILIIIWRVYG